MLPHLQDNQNDDEDVYKIIDTSSIIISWKVTLDKSYNILSSIPKHSMYVKIDGHIILKRIFRFPELNRISLSLFLRATLNRKSKNLYYHQILF